MNGGRGALGWAMDSMSIFLVFFAGGVFFAFVLPAGKFAVAALAIVAVYLFYCLIVLNYYQVHFLSLVAEFVCLKLGYVSGLGLRSVVTQRFPKIAIRLQYPQMDKKTKSDVK